MTITVVAVAGTRSGATPYQLARLEAQLAELYAQGARTLHHGCCVGVDGQAHRIARRIGYRIVGHPALVRPGLQDQAALEDCDELLPALPPLERNRVIVDGCDFLLVVPKQRRQELRSGTWATFRYARQIGRGGVLILPEEGNADER